MVIEAGDESQISVVYENIPEGYEIRNQEGTLTIHHEGANFIWGMTLTETPKIHVTVPADVT